MALTIETYEQFRLNYYVNPLTQKCIEDLQRHHNFTQELAMEEVDKGVPQAYKRYVDGQVHRIMSIEI